MDDDDRIFAVKSNRVHESDPIEKLTKVRSDGTVGLRGCSSFI